MKKISSTPNWHYEAQHSGLVAGVDEAGRGPLAGPVIACAVILDTDNIPVGLNDSKALTQVKREALFGQILRYSHVGIGIAEPEEIDRLNVLWATMAAMRRAVSDLALRPDIALIDGNRAPELDMQTQAIVKGDSKSLSIAAASIIAKVTRDRLMVHASTRYPLYEFQTHKGYPTKRHKNLLLDHAPCPIHRYSYAPVRAALISMNETLKY